MQVTKCCNLWTLWTPNTRSTK